MRSKVGGKEKLSIGMCAFLPRATDRRNLAMLVTRTRSRTCNGQQDSSTLHARTHARMHARHGPSAVGVAEIGGGASEGSCYTRATNAHLRRLFKDLSDLPNPRRPSRHSRIETIRGITVSSFSPISSGAQTNFNL